jgi:hypothetical protein
MTIKSKADWLRGFLESLEYSDTISKRQIQLLKEKLNLLLEEIEEKDFSEDDDEFSYNSNSSTNKSSSNNYLSDLGVIEDTDDLPF